MKFGVGWEYFFPYNPKKESFVEEVDFEMGLKW